MAGVSSRQTYLWALADALGCDLEADGNGVRFACRRTVPLMPGLAVPVPLRAVSSAMLKESVVVLCRGMGNLLLFFTSSYFGVTCNVLDSSKFPGTPDGAIEKLNLRSAGDFADVWQDASVAFYQRSSSGAWSRVGEAKKLDYALVRSSTGSRVAITSQTQMF